MTEFPTRLQANYYAKHETKEKENPPKRRNAEIDTATTDAFHKVGLDNRVQERMEEVLREIEQTGEQRNVYMNLTWTGPTVNTKLQIDISFKKLDMFCDLSEHATTRELQDEEAESEGFAYGFRADRRQHA